MSAITLGVAGLLFNLYHYFTGMVVLTIGGFIGALAERRSRQISQAGHTSSFSTAQVILNTPARQGQAWSVPLAAKTFSGRAQQLARIKRLASQSKTSVAVIALHGMVGIGKSQLAMTYAENHRCEFELGWWITASNRLWVIARLAELAKYLGVSVENQEQAARAAVAELGRRRGWLLIYDDAGELANIAGLVPNGHGQVLITSRNPQWGAVAATEEVRPLNDAEAVKLLLSQSGDNDRTAAQALASQLQGLPLALTQAATYCRSRAVSLAEYSERFGNGQDRLLQEGSPAPYPLPVAVTVRLNVHEVARKSPAAVQLLRLLAFVDSAGIPRDLPRHDVRVLPRQLAQLICNPAGLDETVELLLNTSLVSRDRPGYLRTHRLVQELVRAEVRRQPASWFGRQSLRIQNWPDSSASWNEKRWLRAALALLEHAFPDDTEDLRVWTQCSELHPHIDTALAHSHRLGLRPQPDVGLRFKLANYLHYRNEYIASRSHFEQVLAINRKTLGPEHPETLKVLSSLGTLLYRVGQYNLARQHMETLLNSMLDTLEPDHRDMLRAREQLAFVLFELGELTKARSLAEQTLAARLRIHGFGHPETFGVRLTLAASLTEMDRLEDARDQFEEIHADASRILGPEHLATQRAWHNLTRTRADLGYLAEARKTFETITDAAIRRFGALNLYTLFAKHNLARVLWKQGELTEARQLFEEVLTMRRQVAGSDHPKTLTTCHYLARVLAKQGEIDMAREHLVQVINSRRSVLGVENPHTKLAVDDLSELHRSGTTSFDGLHAARKYLGIGA